VVLTVLDPCDPPISLTAAALTDQVYTITDTEHPDYTHPDYTIVPPFCPFRYTYSTTTILSTGDSAITRADKTFSFFYDQPISDYTAAVQVTTVTATSYSIYNPTPAAPLTASETFDTTFLDPCLDKDFVTITATPSSRKSDNFSGANLDYTVAFTVVPSFCTLTVQCDTVLPPNSGITCTETADGSVTYSFDQSDHLGGIQPGDYTINYKVFTGPTPDQDGLQETYALDLTLIDPCLTATITPAVTQNYEYTLTDLATEFPFVSDFSHTPTFCDFSFTDITITSDANSLSSVLTFNQGDQDWEMQQVLNTLIHAGASQTTYTLSVTYNVHDIDGNVVSSRTANFDITIKNPCLDINFVQIVAPDVANMSYRISDPSLTSPAFPQFTYTTAPSTHQLCGDFTYTVVDSNGDLVPTSGGDPTTFNSGDRTFTVFSDSAALEGTVKTYTVIGAFTSYSAAAVAFDNFDVDFSAACEMPKSFTATAQTGITDNYSNTQKTFSLTPFNVQLSRCEVVYDCRGVTKDGSATSQLSCSDLNFDGVFDNVGDDGTFKFTADPARYIDGTLTPGTFTVQICGTVV